MIEDHLPFVAFYALDHVVSATRSRHQQSPNRCRPFLVAAGGGHLMKSDDDRFICNKVSDRSGRQGFIKS